MSEVVLVTGAAQRLGRAIALGLAADGHVVAVHYNRSRAPAEETVAQIRGSGGKAEAVPADLRDETQLGSLVAAVGERFGAITLLVNNASVFEHDEALTADRESWERHMQINLRAPLVLAQHMARALPSGGRGSIVNIVDHRVWKLNPLFFSYTLSKSALWTMTRTLAQALAPRIRVNAIGPGPTLPNAHQDAEAFARERTALPLERGPEPGEIVDGVRFLLASPSLTGQMIALDGGQHLAWQTPDLVSDGGN